MIAVVLAGCTTTTTTTTPATAVHTVTVTPGVSVTLPSAGPRVSATPQPGVTKTVTAAVTIAPGRTVPSALEALAPAQKLTASGPLPAGGVTLTFHVDPATVPTGTVPFLASLDPTSGAWMPAASTYDPRTGAVSAHVTHFSVWTVLAWIGTRVLAAFQGAYEDVFGSATDGTVPTCAAADSGAFITIADSHPAGNVGACAQVGDADHSVVKVANLATYPVDLLYPHGATVQAPDTDLFAQVGEDLNNASSVWHDRILLPPGATAVVTLPLRTGQATAVRTEMDTEAYLASIIGTGLEVFSAVSGKLAGAVEKGLTGLGQTECLTGLVKSAQTVSLSADSISELGADAFQCVTSFVELGAPGAFLDLAHTASALATELVAGFTGAMDTILGDGNQTFTVARPSPTLGIVWGPYQSGYGTVAPTVISNGGDPTGVVTGVHWTSWGGDTARGTGTSDDDNNSDTVADGVQAPAQIVAFDLGVCDGKYMYQKVTWYFPQDGETFQPNDARNICTGE